MILYEFPPTRSIRVRWMLQELDIKFKSVQVNLLADEHRSPEFLKLNPAGKVPVLVDGDLVLTESVAIVLYLAEKFPRAGWLSDELTARAQIHRWLLFTVTELEQPLWRMARHASLYPEQERIPGDIPLARRDFKEMAAVMEAHMKRRTFLVEERVSVADLVAAYTLDWANEVHLLGGFPNLSAYLTRMYARPKAPLRIAEALASIRG